MRRLYEGLNFCLRTILAAFLKTKLNGHFVKNKICAETGKEYSEIVQMIMKVIARRRLRDTR